MIGATTTPMPKTAIATPRLAGGKLSMRIACDNGCSAPPAAPCTNAGENEEAQLVGHAASRRGQREDAMQPIKNRLRPKKPLSQPVIGNTMALETR